MAETYQESTGATAGKKVPADDTPAGKAIDLGEKMGGEFKPKAERSKYYPTINLRNLKADNYFVKQGAGAECTGEVTFRIKSVNEDADGSHSVTLEARTLKPD